MSPRTPGKRHDPARTAVVQVAEDGTATLYLGTELVEHAARVDSTTVMRVLVDYVANIGTGVRVTTQMPDGTWTRHQLDPDGRLTPLPRSISAAAATRSPIGGTRLLSRPSSGWTRIKTSPARSWLIVTLVLLCAVLVAVVASA